MARLGRSSKGTAMHEIGKITDGLNDLCATADALGLMEVGDVLRQAQGTICLYAWQATTPKEVAMIVEPHLVLDLLNASQSALVAAMASMLRGADGADGDYDD